MRNKIILPMLMSALLLMSACAHTAERGSEEPTEPTSEELISVAAKDPEPGAEAEAGTEPEFDANELNEEPEHPDYLAYFRERCSEIGFAFYDVAHLYSEPGLLSAGMAEQGSSCIYLFLLDSPEKAVSKAASLKESFADAEGMDKPVATTTMNGSRYLIAVKGSECYMVISDESETAENMAEWIEVEMNGEEISEERDGDALQEPDAEGQASGDADAGQSQSESGNGADSDGEPEPEPEEATEGADSKHEV